MNKKLIIILASLFLVLIFLNSNFNESFLNKNSQNLVPQDCFIQAEERIVRGNSLSPLIKSGQTVKVLFDYYDCNKIKNNDIVLFNYAGNNNPLIKIVRGVSGDRFELKKSDSRWNILINNQIVKNSEGKIYFVSGNEYKMLSLYERDYKGIIPENAYLLLGNNISNSIDSTVFGLVDKSGIIAKVEI